MTLASASLAVLDASGFAAVLDASRSAIAADLLRLVAIPVFAWAAIRDVKTRRVPSAVWIPLATLAGVLLVWEGWLARRAGGAAWTHEFLLPAAVSLGVLVPAAYLCWWIGAFGGADAKALLVLALLFPTVPAISPGGVSLPAAGHPELLPLSLTIVTNAAVIAVAFPLLLALRNAAAGRLAPVMFVGWPIRVERVEATHGLLLETPDGLTTRGLDLDALRMYLRWRGLTLAELREDPGRYRDPASLPDEPNPPTDGMVESASLLPDGGREVERGDPEAASAAASEAAAADSDDGVEVADPWGAAAFLADIEGSAYGTTADGLRDGLEVLSGAETVWISPGTPLLVPVFAGLVAAVAYGNLLLPLLA